MPVKRATHRVVGLSVDRPRPDACLREHLGAMTLFVNGTPVPLVSFKPTELPDEALFSATVARSVPDMASRGVHLQFVPTRFNWPGEGQYDFEPLDHRVRQVLDADPDAWIVIRIQASSMAPQWWLEAHPDEVLRFAESVDDGNHRHVPWQTPPTPSLASSFWTGPAVDAMTQLGRHVLREDYAHRVIGYLPTAFNTNEWFLRSYDDMLVAGLCPAMQRAFDEHMRRVTGGTESWRVPGRAERGRGDHGYLMHPDPSKSHAPVVEFYRLLNGLCSRAIIDLTRALREVHDPQEIIVGTFYGYCMDLANFYWLADSGHLDLGTLLQAEGGPDFVCSPLEYFTRNTREHPGGGFCWAQGTAPDSARLVGKAYFGEDDFCPPTIGQPYGWTSAADEDEDAELLKRNFVFSLCKGQMQWWYDLHGHWYESPERLHAVDQCTRIANEALSRDRSSVSQVAVVLDEQAPWYLALDRQLQRAVFWENFFHTVAELGAPVDLVMLSDLPRLDPKQYRAMFFPTCFALGGEQRRWIEQFKSDGRWLVFYQAAGYIDPQAAQVMDDQHLRALTGMQIIARDSIHQMRITTDRHHPLVQGFADQTFGVHCEKVPNFHVEDEAAEPMGWYCGHGPIGLARKTMDGWTSVYCGVPAMPGAIARHIVEAAGVHRYIDAVCPMYACRSYIGLFSRENRPITVELPDAKRVRDCFTDRMLAEQPTRRLVLDAYRNQAHLLELI